MSRNIGTMSLAAGNPVVTGTTTSSTVHNNTLNDIANEITNSIPRDGTAPPTANLPMGGFKHTGMAAGTVSGDSATYEQTTGKAASGANGDITSMTALTAPTVAANPIRATDIQTQLVTAFTTGGTSSAFTVTAVPALTTYTNSRLAVTLNAAPTGSPTINYNGLGAKSLKYKDGSGTKQFVTSIQAPSGYQCDLWYDGTDVVLLNPLPSIGIMSNSVVVYTATATLTTADLGRHCYYQSATAGTLTLPSVASCPIGSIISVYNSSTGICTIQRAGADAIYAKALAATTAITLANGDSYQLVSVGGGAWVQVMGSASIGIGQTWQNVTGSRALSTNYTNSTGKPIEVLVELACTATTTQVIIIDGLTVSSHAVATAGVAGQTYSFIVPDGIVYQVQNSASALTRWFELRT
jgi:hypothetical protein